MARDFSGTNQFLSGTFAVATTVPLSMACWFNQDASAVDSLLVLSDGTVDNQFLLELQSLKVNAVTNNAKANTSTTFTAGTWNHGCATFTSATSRAAFLNGGGKGTSTTSKTPAGIVRTDIAQNGDGTQDFAGLLAEVGIWNIILSDADVADLAKGFSPLLIKRRWLVAYYPLLGRQSGREIDLIGGRHLTVTGATQTAHPRILTAEDVMTPHVPAAVAGFVPYPRPRGLEGGLSVMTGGMA